MNGSLRVNPYTILRRVEYLYVIVALLLLSRAFRFLLGSDEESLLATVLLFGMYALSLPFVLWRFKRFLWVMLRDKLLLVVIAFALLSILWSVAPETTLRRSIVLLGGTYFGMYLAASFDLKTIIRLLAWTFLVAAGLSIVVTVAVPELGVGSGSINRAWTGIYDQKNVLGRVMAVGALTFWYMARRDAKRMRFVWWAAMIASVTILIFSRSSTSLVILILTLALMPAYQALRLRDRRLTVGILALALLAVSIVVFVFATDANLFFTTLGRNPEGNTFLGRLNLWGDLWRVLQPRLWLGYGYGAFWRGFEGPSAEIWALYRWKPGHAHNGYLDIWLDLGLLGLLLVLAHVVASFGRVAKLIRSEGTSEAFWVLSYLIVLVLANSTYSLLISQSVFFWTIYVAATLGVCVELARARSRRAATEKASRSGHPLPA